MQRKENTLNKLVPHSIMLARNEAEDIIGIIKEGLFFAENVWVIVDPDTTDDTVKIIQNIFKTDRVHVEYQIKDINKIREIDQSIDSDMQDESFQGHISEGKGRLFMHWNITYWVNKIVKKGEWWHWVSPDERFAPRDYHEIWFWVRYAQNFGYEAVYTVDHLFIRDEITKQPYDWCIWFTNPGTPHHFLKMPENGWKKGLGAHTGCTLPDVRKRFKMPVSHYHFAYVKESRIPFKGPRDHPEYQFQPRYQFYNPMDDDWRALPEVDVDGNLIPPCNITFDKLPEYKTYLVELQIINAQQVTLQKQLLEKQDSLKNLDNDTIKAQDHLKILQAEFARIDRVRGWRKAEIEELEKQINKLEEK